MFSGFNDQYRTLLTSLMDDFQSAEEVNSRTGHSVRALRYGTTLQVDLSDGMLPVVDVRRTYPGTAAAEVAWFLSGSNDVTWLRRYAGIWDKFVEPGTDVVRGAYGYRWRREFGRDQLGAAVDALLANPSDRRVYVSTWDPSRDGLGAVGQRNVPCPVGFTLSVVAGRLNSTLLIRSSDVFVGLPYDCMGHAMLVAMVAESVGARLGVMSVSIAHPHVYDSHYDMAREALLQPLMDVRVPLMHCNLAFGTTEPDALVQLYREAARMAPAWPKFNPRPELVL